MNVVQARRNNLNFLIRVHGSQTALATELASKRLTQPILSAIQRGKRSLHPHEAREIERSLGIPAAWMDHDQWVRSGWRYCKAYRQLDSSAKIVVDGVVKFVLSQSNP